MSIPSIVPWLRDYTKIKASILYEWPPKIIYKYSNLDRAKDLLSTKNLWFSSPNSFNDPFDMYYKLMDTKVNKERIKDFTERNKQNSSRSEKRAFARDMLKKQHNLQEFQKRQFEDFKENSGVTCFSKKHDISLMWSHYADSHRGVVVGFNINPTQEYPLLMVAPVNYMDVVKSKSYYDDNIFALIHWIITKSSIWKYEEEIRAFYINRNGLIDFDPDCVKEIYFGCKTPQKDIDDVVEIVRNCKYKNILFKRMVIDDDTFDIKTVDLDYKH